MTPHTSRWVLAAVLALLPGMSRADVNVARTENAGLDVGGMLQLLALGEAAYDPYKSPDRVYLFVKEARLRAYGNYKDFNLHLEMGLGGEDLINATTGVSLSLLDMSLDVPVRPLGNSFVRVGQFKVPYGREQLTYSGYSQLVDRSIDNLGFQVGRDVGASFNYRQGMVTAIGGVFTGGGRDIPSAHYLPEQLGVPLLVARVGYGNVDEDPYLLKQNDFTTAIPCLAVFVNGLYTRDSMLGHSSVLNIKLANKSLLLDGNWNPFIGRAPTKLGEWWQVGADAAARFPFGPYQFSAEVQGDWAGFDNDYGVVHVAGARAQAGIGFRDFEGAIRYAFLVPDSKFANSGVALSDGNPMHELTPAVSWYIRGHDLKVVADVPLLFHVPVFTEANVGSYVGTEMPDQAAILAKPANYLSTRSVVEGRLMVQGQF